MHPFFSFLISIISTLNFILSFSHHIYVHRQILYQMTESSTVHYRTSKPGYWLKRLSEPFSRFAPPWTGCTPGTKFLSGTRPAKLKLTLIFWILLKKFWIFLETLLCLLFVIGDVTKRHWRYDTVITM